MTECPSTGRERTSELQSPVTESNRRPSPYHSCLFHPTGSLQVPLSQVAGILTSEYVALGLLLSAAVVTWFRHWMQDHQWIGASQKSWVRLIGGRVTAHAARELLVASVYIADSQSDPSKASGSAIANEDSSILIYYGRPAYKRSRR